MDCIGSLGRVLGDASRADRDRSALNTVGGGKQRRPKPATKTILVVDDNAMNLRLFVDLFQSRGYRTVSAVDGPSAVAAAQAHRPSLVLMDLQLPGMSGLDATRAIKADPDLSHIPIIAVTAFAMKSDEAQARKAGCDGYVTKPASVRKLLDMVSSFIGVADGA